MFVALPLSVELHGRGRKRSPNCLLIPDPSVSIKEIRLPELGDFPENIPPFSHKSLKIILSPSKTSSLIPPIAAPFLHSLAESAFLGLTHNLPPVGLLVYV